MEIDYIALFVADVQRSLIFYRDVLGFEFSKPPQPDGAEGRSGTLRIGLYERSWLPKLLGDRGQEAINGNAFLLSMTVIDLDQVYQQLLKAQVHIVQPPQLMPWGQRILFFNDPDGNLLEIVQQGRQPDMVN
jgi:lactoylglutathione lyase